MIDIIDEEDNYDENDSNPKSKKTPINSSKKIRRSRIIISETNDNPNDTKKEIFEPETKYRKNILSASSFNDYINSSRRQNSKHFLKRKIKAAFEREPIDKGKGFCFNVPFIPNGMMFAPPQAAQPQQQINRQNVNIKDTKSNLNSDGPKLVGINTNTNTNSNTNTNTNSFQVKKQSEPLSHNNMENPITSTSKSVFNVNQSTFYTQKQPLVAAKSEDRKPNEHMININLNNVNNTKMPIDHHNPNSQNQSNSSNSNNNFQLQTSSVSFNSQTTSTGQNNSASQSNQIKLNTSNYTPEQIEAFKAKILAQKQMQSMSGGGINNVAGNNPNANPNYEFIKQQQLKYKQLFESYKADPEKLKREMGVEEFTKFQNLIIKNINSNKNKESLQAHAQNLQHNNSNPKI